MGILDYLTGDDAAASPWGALYNQPGADPMQAQKLQDILAAQQAASIGGMGINPNNTGTPAPSIFGDPSQSSVANPTAPQQAAPPTGFGAGAAPFGFAGPGSMSGISPAMMAGAPQPAAPQVAQQPQPPATDFSSVNRPPVPVARPAAPPAAIDDGEDDAPAAPAGARPGAPGAPPGAPPQAAPFSLGGAASGIGDRLGMAARGFMGNMGAGPIGALMAGTGSLLMGRESDPTAIAQGKMNATGQALVAKGAPIADVQAAMSNQPLMAALVQQYYGKDKYKVQQTGEDGMGRKTFQLFNESDGTFKPIPGASGAAAGDSGIGDMTKKGPEYLATVPPKERNTIEMMLKGDLPPPTSFALAKPYWQNMIAAARNVDPNFSETNWSGRVAMTRSAQGDGKMGQNNNAIITGIGHLGQLNDAIPALNNSEHSQTYNRVSNAIATEFGGTGATNFNAIANRVAPEIVKIWRGTGGAEADIKRDIDTLNGNTNTPSQIRGAIANIAGMMRSKLESNQQEYKATMGRDLPMTPEQTKTLSLLDSMSSGAGGGSASAASAAPAALPAGWSVKVH